MIAFSSDGTVIERIELSYDEYYEGLHPLVDSDEYRAAKKIRRMTGEIYGYRENLQQSFETQYAGDGSFVRGRAVHEDGTVIEH